MLPIFPTFKQLTLADKDTLENISKKFLPYSDYNFTSLWTYDTNNLLELSILNENLVIQFQDYITEEPFYSFLGVNKTPDTINILVNHALRNGMDSTLKLIPEVVINKYKPIYKEFSVLEDRDNFDYIISAEEMALLPEPKYKRKKYYIERFINQFSNYEVRFLDLKKTTVQKEILDLFFLWEKIGEKSRNDTQVELDAIKRLIAAIDYLNVFTLGIYINNDLRAFSIYEITHHNYGISAFQKADKNYEGLYAMLNHEVAKHLHSLNCKLINYEQDLGIDGLRNSKISYHPVNFLKKYKITLR